MRAQVSKLRFAVTVTAITGLVGAGAATAAVTVNGTPAATPSAHGSVGEVYATGLVAKEKLALLNSAGKQVATKTADSLGGVVFYGVTPGSGYRVEQLATRHTLAPVTVHTAAPAPWTTTYQHQAIADHGYQYLTTRDGTQLAIYVHPPTAPPVNEQGFKVPDNNVPAGPAYAEPYPTLIEYSGYGYANPSAPESSIAAVANALGFAVVDVNMRGTGCSGGAFNFFEPLQGLDGYDVIETIAHQSWVKDAKVGMMGISYGGISQLFTAQYQPPDLEAIAPLSVIDATATTLYPGGILNTGFAVAWAQERQQNAEAATAPDQGQAWAYQQIQSGDTTCKANQVLHGEAQDLMATIRANAHYNASYADTLDPVTFVNKIKVPVFMACQWTDEQTGGHCPTLAEHMTGTSKKWFTFTNGAHIDSLDPYTYERWYDFLSIYVNHQAPLLNAPVAAASVPVVDEVAMGVPAFDSKNPQNNFSNPPTDPATAPVDPIWAQPTLGMAQTAFEALPQIRILFDNGAGTSPTHNQKAGDPYPVFEQSFAKFPIPGTTAKRFYLGAKGTLNAAPASTRGINSYTSNPNALPKNDFTGNTETGGLWGNSTTWSWNWKPNPAGTSVSYVTAPLASDTTVIGAGGIQLWVRSSTPDVDLVATVSEVSADGKETFVQNGFLRASERKLASTTSSHTLMAAPSTTLEPVLSMTAKDAAPMPKNQFVPVTIPLYYEGHVYRAGTRIRITVAAPNGTQPIWSFSNTQPAKGTSTVSVEFSRTTPSSVVLPVVPGVAVPANSQPACGSLRDEPCRPYTPVANRVATS